MGSGKWPTFDNNGVTAMPLTNPFLPPWLTRYPRQHLRSDLLAGVLVAILVLPQSLAYALLAGLPPQAGLLVSIFPVIAYALVGSSMTQAVGPVAITAIMTITVLSPLAAPASVHYVELAAALALLSGLLVLVFGLLKLGFLANLLSRPVLSGFISGSAVLIVISQAKLLLGLTVQGNSTWELVLATVRSLPDYSPATVTIALAALLLLLLSRSQLARWLQSGGVDRSKANFIARLMPLITVVAGTLAVVNFDLDRQHGVAVVGSVQEALPAMQLALPAAQNLAALAVPALVLAFIGTVQNIAMAQALAIRRRERVDANRELIGLGCSNIVAAVYGGMPVGGGVSRTAVNVASGAQTPLASVVSALFMLLIVLVGPDWFARLPLAVLAASIVLAAISMIDIAALRRAWNHDRADAVSLCGTALGVLLLGLQWGIAVGIGLSLASLLFRASTPHIAVVGRIIGTEHFRNVERHGVETLPGVLFVRIDESLFFGNFAAIEHRLSNELARAPRTHTLVLLMSAVNRVDVTALEALGELQRDLRDRAITLHLAEVKGPVQDRLARSPLWQALAGKVHLSAHEAFEVLSGEDRRCGAGFPEI
jgi:SulP family sulfate permease